MLPTVISKPAIVVLRKVFNISIFSFEYSDINVIPTGDGAKVSLKVKNIGEVGGKEVVELYVSDRVSTVSKPEKELKDFAKIYLESGEEKEVVFNISDSQLAYYNLSMRKWTTEPGAYDILVGSSSRDIRLKGEYIYDKECEYTLNYSAEQIMG